MSKPHICLDDCITACRFGEFAFRMRRTEIAMRIGISLERCYPDFVAYGNVAFDTGIKWDGLFTVQIAMPFHDQGRAVSLAQWKAGFDSRFSWDLGRIVPGMTSSDVVAAYSEVEFDQSELTPEYLIESSLAVGDCLLLFQRPGDGTVPTLCNITLFRPPGLRPT